MRVSGSVLAAMVLMAGCAAPPVQDQAQTASIAAVIPAEAPSLAWTFQNMDALVPVASVDRGTGPVDVLETRDVDLSPIRFTTVAGQESNPYEFLDTYAVDAFLVVQDGVVLFEHYANGQTAETRHIVYSVTKSFTALLAELLIHDGVLDDARQLSAYVPELAGSAYADTTLREALNMQVGADFSEIYDDPDSSIAQFAYAAGVAERPAGQSGPDNLHDFLPTIAKKGEHGGPFHYNTATTEVVGWVIERASGKTVPELLSERIYSRIGAENDGYFLAADTNGTAMAGGGLNVTARDLARLGLLIERDGRGPDGEEIIPASIVEKIRAAELSLDDWIVPGGTSTYRSFWYVNGAEGIMAAYGIHGQALYVSPNADLVTVMQSSNETAEGAFFVDFEYMSNAIAANLTE